MNALYLKMKHLLPMNRFKNGARKSRRQPWFLEEPKRLSAIFICCLICILAFSGFMQFKAIAVKPSVDGMDTFADFETHLDNVRQILKIPGMSAAVVQNQKLIWSAGFGYADLENQVAATPDTPYGLASVTKPVAAVLIMQLIEEGLMGLDAPIADYGVHWLGDEITVRHLLTHTSEGIPGTKHDYNGSRYGYLAGVAEGATGKTFAENLSERILIPLKMKNTALNPINQWGGASQGFTNLEMMLGWGDAFQHYPDVYSRLASPYQFDGEYNIIPGMYHLYHNAAAGLVSSVTDLAKFDIALDQGLLLGEVVKAEMFAPAYSTYENRTDLNYGLGWYVQDFEGLQLLWHTGRWPPSTSALYLKVPEKNLTFIVLANTDNLTVPFAGIGAGDVSQSTLTLSFFRYFIFPEQHGYEVPRIDWGADQAEIIQQLKNVEDENAREFLERELWSFRQAFASSGHTERADALKLVALRAFPVSTVQRDWMFTNTTSQFPVIPPALHATFFVWLGRMVIVWLGLVVISAIWMAAYLYRAAEFSLWGKIILWLSALFLGPISLISVYRLGHPGSEQTQPSIRMRAWVASVLSITGYSIAWFIAIAWMMSMGSEPNPPVILGLTYFLPLIMELIFVRIPLRQVNAKLWQTITRSLLGAVITMNLGYAVFFPLTMLISDKLLTQIPYPNDPIFWAMISVIAMAGTIILVPLQYWMIQRGCSIPSGLLLQGTHSIGLPKLRNTWPGLLTTFVILIIALIITITQLN